MGKNSEASRSEVTLLMSHSLLLDPWPRPMRGDTEISLCPPVFRMDLWDSAGPGASSHTPRVSSLVRHLALARGKEVSFNRVLTGGVCWCSLKVALRPVFLPLSPQPCGSLFLPWQMGLPGSGQEVLLVGKRCWVPALGYKPLEGLRFEVETVLAAAPM